MLLFLQLFLSCNTTKPNIIKHSNFNPAFNYDDQGKQYSNQRQADPLIAKYINDALGEAVSVLNVGAGSGNYEPEDRYVIAIEPSAEMRSQRLKNNKMPAINAKADALPFDNNSFDASMAILTVHHWPDICKGLKEMQRVTKNKIVVMSFDPDLLDNFWNAQYFPEVITVEKKRYPAIEFVNDCLGGNCEVISVPIPFDCTDGFQEAFYGRPEMFLKKEVRKAQSAWGFIDEETESNYVKALENDLASGVWDKKYGYLRTTPRYTGALKLIVSTL